MKRMNVIAVYDRDKEHVLMCKRVKSPYKELYNLVGGKIEKENDGLNEAYRELFEETGITRDDIELTYLMNFEYILLDFVLEVYFGVLNKDVELVEEVNKLEWLPLGDDMCDDKKYAGDRNIGHIIKLVNNHLKI